MRAVDRTEAREGAGHARTHRWKGGGGVQEDKSEGAYLWLARAGGRQ